LFISGFNFTQGQLVSGLIYAHQPQEQIEPWRDNPQLAKAREVLLGHIALIKNFVRSVGEKSNTVSKLEMDLIQKMNERFFDLREELLKQTNPSSFSSSSHSILTINDASEVAFIFECQEITEIYFSGNLWYQDDSETQIVKKFFRKYTGKEMEIKKSKNRETRIFFGIVLGLISFFIFVMLIEIITDNEYWAFVFGLIAFIFVFVTFCWIV